MVEMISCRTEQAAGRVHEGVTDLRGGQRLKAYVLPVGGAIVGGVLGGAVAGPIGAVAGLKAGALTAATAGTAGVLGGAFIGYRVRQSTKKGEGQGQSETSPTAGSAEEETSLIANSAPPQQWNGKDD